MIGFEIISQIENNLLNLKTINDQCLIYDVEYHKAPY